jgi:hypothetical protein
MIADIRLDRPRARPRLKRKYSQGIDPEEPRAVSNDERQAILAVWYINSRFVASHTLCILIFREPLDMSRSS